MKSFGNYELITEKVSKKEINDGLKDPNIRTGIEYEFLFNNEVFEDENSQVAYEEFRKLKADISRATIEAADAEDDYNKEIMLILAVTLNDIRNKVNELVLEVPLKMMLSGILSILL